MGCLRAVPQHGSLVCEQCERIPRKYRFAERGGNLDPEFQEIKLELRRSRQTFSLLVSLCFRRCARGRRSGILRPRLEADVTASQSETRRYIRASLAFGRVPNPLAGSVERMIGLPGLTTR